MRLKTITLTLLLAILTLACSDTNDSLLPSTPSTTDATMAPETDTPVETETETPPEQEETDAPAAANDSSTNVSGEEAATTPEVLIPHPVINEVVIGIEGNNNHEFIELYNPTAEPIDLNGWSLWYQIRADENPVPIYRWETRTDLPARGYYLLGREGIDLGVLADVTFNEPLFNKGGLFLRNAERQDIDVVGWGDAPAEAVQGSPAPAVENGQSLLRQPNSYAQDNAADFAISEISIPQNSGAPINIANMRANLAIVLPENVKPGQEFDLIFIITNTDPVNDQEIFLSLYIPEGFEPVNAGTELTEDRRLEGSQVVPADTSGSFELSVIAPFTYSENIFNGSYIEVNGQRLYAVISKVTIAGGSIPIATARELIGQTVTVEGTATMYTDGFYAGSTGTKFYIEDETGGIQVYVPDGMGDVNIVLGDLVKVSGEIEPYRTAIEIIPEDYTTDIEVVGTAEAPVKPAPVAIAALVPDNEYIGQLIEISGVATRIEEFTYSYEVDLTDEAGHTTRVYLDKLTNATTEPLVLGESYTIAGIAEMNDGNVQLLPRQQSDFVQIFPPTLRVEVEAPLTVVSDTVPYTIRVINNTKMTLNNIIVTTDVPMGAVGAVDLGDDRVATQDTIKWSVPSLAAGEQIDIRYNVSVTDGERITFAAVTATADEWSEPAVSSTAVTYLGDIIPIYALQGEGFSSPYVGKTVTTEGLITAVFPELGGFWMQTPTADDNPATSEGIFVLTDGLTAAVSAGESVRITGKVRELSGQTTLQPTTADEITNVPNLGNYTVVELQPPADLEAALVYYETLEGMMVKVSDAVAIAPINHFGEYALVQAAEGVTQVMRNDGQNGLMIFVDDGSTMRHEDSSTLPYLVAKGDLVSDVVGPLAYTFDQYKIEPLSAPTVLRKEIVLPALPELADNQFSVATFNVENLFDTAAPHPDNPPRPTAEQYAIKLSKITDAIIRLGAPTIVALQEVENIAILEELAAHERLAPYGYEAFLVEGTDSRGIDNGYLVRTAIATVEDVEPIPAPEGLTSRPPLLLAVTITLGEAEQTVFLLNNHFTSMSAGEAATEPRRDAQAAWNVEILADIISDEDDPAVIVLGDLNSFYDAKPIDTLRAAGLRHVYEFVEAIEEEARPYTYIYQGAGQTLDHILVTPNLYELLTTVTVLHINADYPFAAVDDLSAQHVSDHDPLIAIFTLK